MYRRIIKIIISSLLNFGKNSNIHGLRFISDDKRHWLSRIFWLLTVIICLLGLLEILRGTLKSASQEALSFNPDMNRLRWNTEFPSVTICEKYNYQETLRTINKLFPSFLNEYDYNYKKMFADTCFGENTCTLCNTGCGSDVNCSIDFRALAEKVRQPCSKLIYNCTWQNRPLDCCTFFLPIDSEYGTCYSFNTLQSKYSSTVPTFKSNRTTGPGSLSFLIYKDLDVFIHGREDIPWLKSDIDMKIEATVYNVEFIFEVIEIQNDPLVRDVELEMRKCRFPDEFVPNQFDKTFQVYGYSTCMVICETEQMYKECKCVHHLRDKKYYEYSCNYTGLGCLGAFAENKKTMPVEESIKLCSHCLPSCTEIELTKIFVSEYDPPDDDDDLRVTITMSNLPNIQYRRNVVRSKLDLVVSIGGLAGLFFGASLLSLVEAVYFIFVRVPEKKHA